MGLIAPRRSASGRLDPSPSTLSFSHLARAAGRGAPLRGARRAAAVAAMALAAAALLAAALVDGAGRGSRRYARAWRELEAAGEGCDEGLRAAGRWGRPLWGGRAADGFCVEHAGVSRVGEFPDAEVRFLVVGDWGRDGMCCQRDVAVEMGAAAVNFTPAFVANVGDSFYPSGLRAVSDPQVQSSWTAVYGGLAGLDGVPWRGVLGNHDYRGDVEAQVALTAVEELWHMPRRYYFEEESGGDVLLAFLDTTPLYYGGDEMDEMGGGAGGGGRAGGEAAGWEAVRDGQVAALDARLAASEARVKLVFGHHPLYSSAGNALTESAHMRRMNAQLSAMLSRHGVAAYFSGHEHTMEHTVAGGVHFFVVGTGSKVNPIQMRQAGSVFALGRQGFAAVAVEDTVVHVQFVDMTGHVVHAATVGPGLPGGGLEAGVREGVAAAVPAPPPGAAR